jgi:hypothetical protein
MDDVVKEIAKFSKKRAKTEDDLGEIARLEWLGGLYLDGGTIVMPTANLRKCIIQAAKATKQGKQIERSVYFRDQSVPLVYQGPTDIQKLYDAGDYIHRASVVVASKRIIRVRPRFYPWAIEANIVLNESLLDPEDLHRILTLSGQIEGLCDARNLGFGRFDSEIA